MTVNYYIGTKDKNTKDYKLSNDYIERKIKTAFATEYPSGFTVVKSVGYFKHDDGTVVEEESYIVTVLNTNLVNHRLVRMLKECLNQESIGIQVISDRVIFE